MWNSKRFLSFFIMLAVLSAFVWALPARNTAENLAIDGADVEGILEKAEGEGK